MKKLNKYLLLLSFLFGSFILIAQEIDIKRERRKNQVVKEWNSEGKREWLDHETTYNGKGEKIEEIEYASFGMKERTTFEYNAEGQCIKEVVYNDKNKVYRIRKYMFNAEGRKLKQYNYLPNGKLYSTKRFEYTTGK